MVVTLCCRGNTDKNEMSACSIQRQPLQASLHSPRQQRQTFLTYGRLTPRLQSPQYRGQTALDYYDVLFVSNFAKSRSLWLTQLKCASPESSGGRGICSTENTGFIAFACKELLNINKKKISGPAEKDGHGLESNNHQRKASKMRKANQH